MTSSPSMRTLQTALNTSQEVKPEVRSEVFISASTGRLSANPRSRPLVLESPESGASTNSMVGLPSVSASTPFPPPGSFPRAFPPLAPVVELETLLGRLCQFQDLYVAEVYRNINDRSKVPLCSFFLEHLRPDNLILPFVSLSIRNLPSYQFQLQYIIKETVSSLTGEFINWIAVFIMKPMPHGVPLI